LATETDAQRKTRISSMVLSTHADPLATLPSFVVQPSQLHFGRVALGHTYRTTLKVTNRGPESGLTIPSSSFRVVLHLVVFLQCDKVIACGSHSCFLD
jgi:hypothetical protein